MHEVTEVLDNAVSDKRTKGGRASGPACSTFAGSPTAAAACAVVSSGGGSRSLALVPEFVALAVPTTLLSADAFIALALVLGSWPSVAAGQACRSEPSGAVASTLAFALSFCASIPSK